MTKLRSLVAMSVAGMLLAACAGSSNLVMNPNRSDYKAQTVSLAYDGGTVGVEDQAVAELKKFMEDAFYEKGVAFNRGQELTVKYGFMSFDEGNQAKRYFLGPIGGGEAKMVVGAEFFDAQGNSLAKIQSEGRLSGGFFGGDASAAIKKAAQEVAGYAKANFAR